MILLKTDLQFNLGGQHHTADMFLAYYADGNPAVLLKNMDGPFATLSVNMPDKIHLLGEDDIFIKTWAGNEAVVGPCLESGIFEDTGRRVATGFVEASIWRFTAAAKARIQEHERSH